MQVQVWRGPPATRGCWCEMLNKGHQSVYVLYQFFICLKLLVMLKLSGENSAERVRVESGEFTVQNETGLFPALAFKKQLTISIDHVCFSQQVH